MRLFCWLWRWDTFYVRYSKMEQKNKKTISIHSKAIDKTQLSTKPFYSLSIR